MLRGRWETRKETSSWERACDVGNTGRQRKDDEENENGRTDKRESRGKNRLKGMRE